MDSPFFSPGLGGGGRCPSTSAGRPGVRIDMGGPSDVVNEREGVHELAVLTVDYIEEAVTVGVSRGP